MAAVIGTVERVSNLLVQGVHVGVGGCSHPHPHLYHLTWDDCRRCAVVVRLGATHDPKRKKVAFDPVVTVVPHCLLEGFRGGVVAATWRAMPKDDDESDDDFKLVVLKIGNHDADFDLAAWACVRQFDLAGDAEK